MTELKWSGKAFIDNEHQEPGRTLGGASDKNLLVWLKSARKFGYTQFILEVTDL